MQIRWLLCCAMLAGCSAPTDPDSMPKHGLGPLNSESMPSAQSPGTETAVTVSEADMERYFPISRYRRFPVEARQLLQRADFENEHCRGATDRDADKYRACNRAWEAMVGLERIGWCWGNERSGRPSSDDHWLRCSHQPRYRPGWAGANPPFSEREISEMANQAANDSAVR
jgi:hypothetical protein